MSRVTTSLLVATTIVFGHFVAAEAAGPQRQRSNTAESRAKRTTTNRNQFQQRSSRSQSNRRRTSNNQVEKQFIGELIGWVGKKKGKGHDGDHDGGRDRYDNYVYDVKYDIFFTSRKRMDSGLDGDDEYQVSWEVGKNKGKKSLYKGKAAVSGEGQVDKQYPVHGGYLYSLPVGGNFLFKMSCIEWDSSLVGNGQDYMGSAETLLELKEGINTASIYERNGHFDGIISYSVTKRPVPNSRRSNARSSRSGNNSRRSASPIRKGKSQPNNTRRNSNYRNRSANRR